MARNYSAYVPARKKRVSDRSVIGFRYRPIRKTVFTPFWFM